PSGSELASVLTVVEEVESNERLTFVVSLAEISLSQCIFTDIGFAGLIGLITSCVHEESLRISTGDPICCRRSL
ncbi:MAG: hypothetical protein ACRYF1_27340, partial [Janthinobacterium lividum]